MLSSCRFLLVFLALFLTSCRDQVRFDPMSADEESRASQELESVSQGAIGARGPITIKFRHPWAADDEVGKDADSKFLKFEPSVDGRLWWKDHQTLIFEPAHDLKPGKLHVGKLDLPAITGDKRLPVYRFAVVSATRTAELEPQSFEKSGDNAWKLSVRVEFSSPPKGAGEKWFSVSQSGSSLTTKWVPSGADDGSGVLVVDGVRRNGQKLSVAVDADEAGLESDQALPDLEIPDGDALGVLWAGQWNGEGRNGFEVLLSDAPGPVSDLEGLVKVEGVSKSLQTELVGSRLRVSWEALPGSAKLVLESGLPAASGRKLANRFELNAEFVDLKPMVGFEGSGVILPSPANNQIQFRSVNLSRVHVVVRRVDPTNIPEFLFENGLDGIGTRRQLGEVVWDRVIQLGARRNQALLGGMDLGPMLAKSGAGLYTIELGKVREGMLYSCQEKAKAQAGAIGERVADGDESQGSEEGDGDGEDMNWSERENPCAPSYWYEGWGERTSRNILVSDLGFMAWRDPDGKVSAVVHNLVTAKPWKNIEVQALGPNDAVLASGKTDGDGFVDLAGVDKAVLLRAKSDDKPTQLAFLRLRDGEARNVSRFEVGGETRPDGLRLYLYSERGVYRPGDSIYLGCILRGDDGKALERLPVKMTLRDPQGRVVATTVQRAAVDGHFAWRLATRPEDATGRWSVLAEAGPAQTTLPVLVETVRPNRLKIELDAKTIEAGGQNTVLRSHWLSGGSAAGLEAKVEMSLTPREIAPKGMEGYCFRMPVAATANTEEKVVWEGSLDAEGKANLRLPVPDGLEGPMTAWIRSRVFEPGGQASTDRIGLPLWPTKFYAGLRVDTKDDWGSTATGKPVKLDVAAVNTELKAVAGRKMEILIYRNANWWWWENGDRFMGFLQRSETREVARLSAVSGQATSFTPDSSGQYLVLLRDVESGHVTGQSFHVWGGGDESGSGQASQAPAMLRLQAVKDTVEPGQNLEIRFPSARDGRALVQVMRGRRIVSQQWIATAGDETSWRTKVTPEMRPGVYVQVTQLQKWPVPTDRPLRMWGLVPIVVVDPATRLKPIIELPAELQPETKVKIHLHEASKRPMQVTLAVVDEGLLDLTRFATPNPWPAFYGKEALQVLGWDMHDLVVDAWKGRTDRLFAVGGDDDARRKAAGAKANPFPPMVVVMGPIAVPKGGKDVELEIPRYTGSVRVMVVASSEQAFGSAEKTVAVKAPVMALLTVPRGMAPGDKAEIPVTVFSDRKGSVAVKLSIEGPVTIEGGSDRSVEFAAAGDKIVTFSVRATGALGTAAVHARATAAFGKANVDQPLEVRLPGEMRAIVQEGSPRSGEILSLPIETFGAEGTRKLRLELSSIGLMGLERRIDELVRYPHGCLEQTVSGALPQVFLRKLLPDAPESRLKDADANVEAALAKLRSFQTASGAFALWPGEGRAYEWGTLWAGRFLVAAKAAGHTPPPAIWDPYLAHLLDASARWKPGAYTARGDTLAQVARLDILAQAGKADLSRMNQLRSAPLHDLERWILAAAYVAAGRPDAGAELAAKAGSSVSESRSLGDWLWSDVRDQGLMLEAMVRVGEQEKSLELAKRLRRTIRDGNVWLSTQEGGTALWAIASWLEKRGTGPAFEAQWRVGGGAWQKVAGNKGTTKVEIPNGAAGMLEVKNSGKGALDVLFTRLGIDPPGTLPPPARGLRLAVEYRNDDGVVIDPATIKKGEDFRIRATVVNETGDYLDNLALVQVFPGGWEIRNDRLEGALAESNAIRRVEFRDDRVFHYLSLGAHQSAVIVVGARAAYAGTYLRPGAFVSAMYDGAIQAAMPGGTAIISP